MNRLEWLDTATRKILFLPDRKAVRKELEAHFEDLRDARRLWEQRWLCAIPRCNRVPAVIAEL